jgi:arginase family enzyme
MSWPRITDLFVTEGPTDIALLGAPMNRGAVTPGHYDRAPAVIRQALRRFSTYDVETGEELALQDRVTRRRRCGGAEPRRRGSRRSATRSWGQRQRMASLFCSADIMA